MFTARILKKSVVLAAIASLSTQPSPHRHLPPSSVRPPTGGEDGGTQAYIQQGILSHVGQPQPVLPWPPGPRLAHFYRASEAALAHLQLQHFSPRRNVGVSQESALSALLFLPALPESATSIPTASVQFPRMCCPHLPHQSASGLRHADPGADTLSASLLEQDRPNMAALRFSLVFFSYGSWLAF